MKRVVKKLPKVALCRKCHGNGVYEGDCCPQCGGSGRVWVSLQGEIDIKPFH